MTIKGGEFHNRNWSTGQPWDKRGHDVLGLRAHTCVPDVPHWDAR
jgi:hypothetical protein